MERQGLEDLVTQGGILLDRLERISADSAWAHQASGIRASIARQLAFAEPDHQLLQDLLDKGYEILERAASEIPDSSNEAAIN